MSLQSMNVFKDRLLFMVSSKNEHNLLSKPNFKITSTIIMIILCGFISFLIGKLYCYFEWLGLGLGLGFRMDHWSKTSICYDGPLLAGILLSTILGFFFYVVYTFIIPIVKFIVDYIKELIDEIQLSFRPHTEVVKNKIL
jgi:hypothetical protein